MHLGNLGTAFMKTQVLLEENFTISSYIFPLLHLSHSLLQGLSVHTHAMQMGKNPGFIGPKAYTICWGEGSVRKRTCNWA